MRKIFVDEFMFIEAFQHDLDFEQYSHSRYLDLETGKIIWVFDECERGSILDPLS